MRLFILMCSFLVLIACALMAIKLIKEKKPITDPYLILAILSFFIASWMICKMFGILH